MFPAQNVISLSCWQERKHQKSVSHKYMLRCQETKGLRLRQAEEVVVAHILRRCHHQVHFTPIAFPFTIKEPSLSWPSCSSHHHLKHYLLLQQTYTPFLPSFLPVHQHPHYVITSTYVGHQLTASGRRRSNRGSGVATRRAT